LVLEATARPLLQLQAVMEQPHA